MFLPSLHPQRASIATRLIAWFLAISLIPCILITLITGLLSRNALEVLVRQRLESIASTKTDQVETFIGERRGDAQVTGGPVMDGGTSTPSRFRMVGAKVSAT